MNASITYFDADSQLQTIENAKLSTYDRTEGWYYGSITFTSRSTYQLVAASIQTNGKLAGCATRINGESSGSRLPPGSTRSPLVLSRWCLRHSG